jgi:hypothetical protein
MRHYASDAPETWPNSPSTTSWQRTDCTAALAMYLPGTSAETLAELDQIIDSIDVEPLIARVTSGVQPGRHSFSATQGMNRVADVSDGPPSLPSSSMPPTRSTEPSGRDTAAPPRSRSSIAGSGVQVSVTAS